MTTILHARDVCMTNEPPIEQPGRPATSRSRGVVCPLCDRAGIVATPGHEDELIQAWATRNGYRLELRGDQYLVLILDQDPITIPRRN